VELQGKQALLTAAMQWTRSTMPSTAKFETQRVGVADNEGRNEVSDLPLVFSGCKRKERWVLLAGVEQGSVDGKVTK
jgi:hypothetical protein